MKYPTKAEIAKRQQSLDQICDVFEDINEATQEFEMYLEVNNGTQRVDLLGELSEH